LDTGRGFFKPFIGDQLNIQPDLLPVSDPWSFYIPPEIENELIITRKHTLICQAVRSSGQITPNEHLRRTDGLQIVVV